MGSKYSNKSSVDNKEKSTRTLFLNRKRYRRYGHPYDQRVGKDHTMQVPESIVQYQPAIDLIYEKPLYGKVDPEGNAIQPIKSKLAMLWMGGGTHGDFSGNVPLALDFIAHAQKDFFREWNDAVKAGKTKTKEGLFVNPTVARGAADFVVQYQEHITTQMSYFTGDYLTSITTPYKHRALNISTFDHFVKEFLRSIDDPRFPTKITKTAFAICEDSEPRNTALMFDIGAGKVGDDNIKYMWLEDPNWEMFMKLAARYGFVVDKNIPWRFIADLGSQPMAEYMDMYETNIDLLWYTHYDRVYAGDLTTLKAQLSLAYNNYVAQYPYIKKTDTTWIGKSGVYTNMDMISGVWPTPAATSIKYEILPQLIYRTPTSQQELELQYTDSDWMQLYIQIRNIELGYPFDDIKMHYVADVAEQLWKALDITQGMQYINTTFAEYHLEEHDFNDKYYSNNAEEALQDASARPATSANGNFTTGGSRESTNIGGGGAGGASGGY